MRKFGLILLLVGLYVTSGLARPAAAIKSFQVEFEKLYVVKGSDSQLAKLFEDDKKDKKKKKLRCLCCHQGKKKKHNNAYGRELAKLLDKKKDKKDKEKIIAALEKVAEMPSDPNDENSKTFGELLAAGMLPGGPLEEVMKEPKETKDKKTAKEEPEQKEGEKTEGK